MNNINNPTQTTEQEPKKDKLGLFARTGGAVALGIAAIGGATTAVEASNQTPDSSVTNIAPAPAEQAVVPGTVLADKPQPRREAPAEVTPSSMPEVSASPLPTVEEGHTGVAKHEDKKPKVVVGDDALTDFPAPPEPEGQINIGDDAMPAIPPEAPAPTPSETPNPTPITQ